MTDFDWVGYLDLAKKQEIEFSATGNEAIGRCAVSRAYYAALNRARVYLEKVDHRIIPKGTESHNMIINMFKTHPTKMDVADELDQMKNMRITCDYRDPKISNLNLLIMDCIARSTRVINFLK